MGHTVRTHAWFRVHLSTLLALTLGAAVFLGLNLRKTQTFNDGPYGYSVLSQAKGFPWTMASAEQYCTWLVNSDLEGKGYSFGQEEFLHADIRTNYEALLSDIKSGLRIDGWYDDSYAKVSNEKRLTQASIRLDLYWNLNLAIANLGFAVSCLLLLAVFLEKLTRRPSIS